jgi:signal transduction histidine kinase
VILECAGAGTRDLYLPPEHFLGKSMQVVLPPAVGHAISESVRQALASGSMVSLEYDLSFAPADVRTFEARVVPMVERQQVLAIIRNITARQRAEEELAALLAREKAARAAAEQAVSARDEFLSIASHELRTPFTSLQLAIQSILRLARTRPEGAPGGFALQVLEAADRQGRKLAALIDRLLDISRIDGGLVELERAPMELDLLAHDVIKSFLAGADGTDREITLEAVPVVGTWDRARLEQVLVNLLSNAVKYGRGKPIAVRVGGDATHGVLEVADGGIGIAPDRQPHVFERFERAVSARHYGGLGLGLYIVRRIVEAHGGTVSLRSVLDEGSTFTVTLPHD